MTAVGEVRLTEVFVTAEIILFGEEVSILFEFATVAFDILHHGIFACQFVVIGKMIRYSRDECGEEGEGERMGVPTGCLLNEDDHSMD